MAVFNGASTTNFGGNTATSNFSPTIFSKKVLNFLRTASVVEGITNNDYFGELSAFGDTVEIIKEPDISVAAYTRGLDLTTQAVSDDKFILEIDQANYFQFEVDDIEAKLSHVNWDSLTTGSATYALKNAYDKEVLTFMSTAAQVSNIVTATTASDHSDAQTKAITLGHGASDMDPLDLLAKVVTRLDEEEVPEEGRYVVVSPRFMELLAKTDSKLLSTDFNQGEGGLKNGLVMSGKLRGLSVYKTNNLPKFDTGAGDIIIAGHMSAVATVSCLDKIENIRSEKSFGDRVRGLHVYGRGVVRPESIVSAYVDYA